MDKREAALHATRKSNLKQKYGLTLEQYEQMVRDQNGVCAICGRPEKYSVTENYTRRLSVDHNHKTGKTRGLLCRWCNQRLAHIEDEEFRVKAEEYLQRFC